MVIRVAESHSHARFTDVVNVEVGEAGCHHSHSNHLTEVRCDQGDMQDEGVLAHRVGDFQHFVVAPTDQVFREGELWVGSVLVEWVYPAIADRQTC